MPRTTHPRPLRPSPPSPSPPSSSHRSAPSSTRRCHAQADALHLQVAQGRQALDALRCVRPSSSRGCLLAEAPLEPPARRWSPRRRRQGVRLVPQARPALRLHWYVTILVLSSKAYRSRRADERPPSFAPPFLSLVLSLLAPSLSVTLLSTVGRGQVISGWDKSLLDMVRRSSSSPRTAARPDPRTARSARARSAVRLSFPPPSYHLPTTRRSQELTSLRRSAHDPARPRVRLARRRRRHPRRCVSPSPASGSRTARVLIVSSRALQALPSFSTCVPVLLLVGAAARTARLTHSLPRPCRSSSLRSRTASRPRMSSERLSPSDQICNEHLVRCRDFAER